ncbi:hypothetical protein, partial [Thiolapillus sp.]|uniref:hypothetical protein n=1 Tax=Thiolapillus sp. TaxID=2017437 RepID=UPI003AF4AACF
AQTIGSRSIRVTCSEEPDAGNPHVRFCEGESQQWPIYSTSASLRQWITDEGCNHAGDTATTGCRTVIQSSIGE